LNSTAASREFIEAVNAELLRMGFRPILKYVDKVGRSENVVLFGAIALPL
jgi:hypothetical protein